MCPIFPNSMPDPTIQPVDLLYIGPVLSVQTWQNAVLMDCLLLERPNLIDHLIKPCNNSIENSFIFNAGLSPVAIVLHVIVYTVIAFGL